MLLALAAISAVSMPAPQTNVAVRASARVAVRIVSGARVSLGKPSEVPGQRARQSFIRTEDGSRRYAQLIEFY